LVGGKDRSSTELGASNRKQGKWGVMVFGIKGSAPVMGFGQQVVGPVQD